MWRVVLVLGLLISAFSISPVRQSEAGLAACMIDAVDQETDFVGLNYFGYAYARCWGEDWQDAAIVLRLEYYDWGQEEWRHLSIANDCRVGSDDFIACWTLADVPSWPGVPGIVCRRTHADFVFTHSGRKWPFTEHSNGECY